MVGNSVMAGRLSVWPPESASTVQYYIEAVDTAATPNTSVAPATGSSASAGCGGLMFGIRTKRRYSTNSLSR